MYVEVSDEAGLQCGKLCHQPFSAMSYSNRTKL